MTDLEILKTKLDNIDDNYLLLGLHKFHFIDDVIEYVEQTKTSENVTFQVASTIMHLLRKRLIKSDKEIKHIERAKRNEEMYKHSMRILESKYGNKARPIYANIRTVLHEQYSVRNSEPVSLIEAVNIIGIDEYERIVQYVLDCD